MPATATDRLSGITTSVAVKAPVTAVSTANLTLSGLQTVGGVALAEGDRVLVKDQTTASQNGIYVASATTWKRARDFDGARDVVCGTLIVANFDNGGGLLYRLTTPNPITIDITALDISPFASSSILIPQTETEGLAGVTPVNTAFPELDVRRYGNKTGGYYPQAALVAAIKVAAVAKGAAFVADGVNVKITAPLDTLTDAIIRIRGPVSCWSDNAADTTKLPTITCDNCSLVGAYDPDTETATFLAQCLNKLENVCIVGINGAKAGAVFSLYGAVIRDTHFAGFSHVGCLDFGSTFCDFRASFYNVGEGREASGALGSDTFIDGCGVLAVAGNYASGAPGNVAAARAFTGNYGGSKTWDILHTQTPGYTSTSFKCAIFSNQRAFILRARSYSGVWLGYCHGVMPSPHLEVYATGGAVADDGQPLCLVSYNSAVKVEDHFLTAKIDDETASPVASIRHLRTTPFNSANDFWGYEYSNNSLRAMSRAHCAELVFGDYRPDANSYAATPVHDLGTAANPNAVYDATLKALLVSQGGHFYPLLAFPQFQTGTIADSANSTTSAPPTSNWSLGGGAEHPEGGEVYEYDLLVVNAATGTFLHHSVWRRVRMTGNAVVYKLAEANPTAGITVTASGANLNIANAAGVEVRWSLFVRIVRPAVSVPAN